jgi:hypothetical protein
LQKARLGKLPANAIEQLRTSERQGLCRKGVEIRERKSPEKVSLPNPDYRPYNKAVNKIVYAAPTHVIYWKDDGDAVITYKKTGNWYLRGVGGRNYFFREGITWQLIASRMHMRYLPEGYVLDSGAPCAFTREGVQSDELYFALGWTLTKECNRILKEVINHTKNIQSKDFERLPYPFWASEHDKNQVIRLMKQLIMRARGGEHFDGDNPEIKQLEVLFAFRDRTFVSPIKKQEEMIASLF